jgi:hypothetical protein
VRIGENIPALQLVERLREREEEAIGAESTDGRMGEDLKKTIAKKLRAPSYLFHLLGASDG